MTNNIRIQRCKQFLSLSSSLWAIEGYDRSHGGFVEAFDFDARPLTHLNRRFRIHPRTIFAQVAGTIWGYYDGLDIAEQAFDFITDYCWLPKGGFATLSDSQGTILDTSVYTYDHSFVMLGFGWLYYATKKNTHKEWLMNTWEFLQSTLSHPSGGFYTGINSKRELLHTQHKYTDPVLLQNPHMHMLESMLNLIELFDEDIWREQAIDLFSLFSHHFMHQDKGILIEYFDEHWNIDTNKGHSLEPGHHAEWVWILQKYESLMNIQVPELEILYKYATTIGSNERQFGYDETHIDGHVIRDTHRMWVHTEMLKAHIAMYRRSQNIQYITQANHTLDTLFQYYLITDKNIWYDQLDDNLQNISENAPTSTLYHLIIALHEYISCVESIS